MYNTAVHKLQCHLTTVTKKMQSLAPKYPQQNSVTVRFQTDNPISKFNQVNVLPLKINTLIQCGLYSQLATLYRFIIKNSDFKN